MAHTREEMRQRIREYADTVADSLVAQDLRGVVSEAEYAERRAINADAVLWETFRQVVEAERNIENPQVDPSLTTVTVETLRPGLTVVRYV